MLSDRRLAVILCSLAAAVGATTFATRVQAFPTQPVRIIVPSPTGGVTDALARALANGLSAEWKQPVVVENRSGAAQMVGAAAVASAPADGHTLLVAGVDLVTSNPALYKSMPLDPGRDLVGVAHVGNASPVLVSSSTLPVANLPELIQYARAHPGALSYGSSGAGTYAHVGMEDLKRRTGIQITHIPYRGTAPLIQELIGGGIHLTLTNVNLVKAHLDSGRLRLLGTSASKRLSAYPSAEPLGDKLVPQFEANTWWAVFAPARTPAAALGKLNADIRRIAQSETFKRGVLTQLGLEAEDLSLGEVQQKLVRDQARTGRLIREIGVTID